MKLLFLLLNYSRRLVILAIITGVVSGASNIGLLAMINASLNSERPSTSTLILGYIGFCLLFLLARFASEMLLTTLGQTAHFDLRMKLSRQILAAPLRHLEELGAPRLLASLTEDIPVITNALLIIPNLCIASAVFASGLVYLGWLSWPTLLATLVLIAIGVFGYQLQVKRAASLIKTAREYADTLFKHFRALTDGTKELKLHSERREAFLNDELRTTAHALRHYNVRSIRIYAMAASWGQTFTFVSLGGLIFAFPYLKSVERATLASFTITLLYLTSYIPTILSIVPALARATVSLRKVEELGLTLKSHTSEEEAAYASEPLSTNWKSFELVGVTHTYHRERENSKFVLGPINLAFRPGELVFIIGGNGSGKTTLAKLIVGLYVPDSGEIRFNGEPVTARNREYFRQHFSVLFSDYYLFENLLGLKKPELDRQAQAYLTQLQLDHKVQISDGKLSTIKLSAGQRKRLALLTAFLEDRPIYLFDEWAADQDPVFKEFFYLGLLPELKARGKTVLVISHDDHYYYVADHLIKLDYGKIELDEKVSERTLVEAMGRAANSSRVAS